jgi:hypothetical protein
MSPLNSDDGVGTEEPKCVCISVPPDIQSIPNFWNDSRGHIKDVITDLLVVEDTSQAQEIAEMALSYYVDDDILTNETLVGKHIEVGKGRRQVTARSL